MKRRKWPDLPPDVAAHVDKKVQSINWEALLSDLMDACAGCPARNGNRARLWAAWKATRPDSEVKAFYDSLEDKKKP